ncbi:hypothetical protein Acry_2207 [Acidiphilium cryptum JF-5]|uniref:Uncharacterized protein n=1 Tax=Acidiphilium cryptum (strain JF-5) TaxID=349163 RepID=A5G0M3_ACICJ|nr:hypothetical protein Acry_2207 [Acidiphilium cryptum JF-5]
MKYRSNSIHDCNDSARTTRLFAGAADAATLAECPSGRHTTFVTGPARAGEKGTSCASAGLHCPGSKSMAAPATVSGEPVVRPPARASH